jgi:hypothetical protein
MFQIVIDALVGGDGLQNICSINSLEKSGTISAPFLAERTLMIVPPDSYEISTRKNKA